eukprot:TRINITY_DN7728_c0_g2_i1.p1 TRINITY_DN7728_c0_g2~~TRINITY_DN7728_c0_g2_i1.p1  ORF type:complete len:483 (+),score=96.65 TRINITY_DN7728_c0_g2_i1:74-1522(+)
MTGLLVDESQREIVDLIKKDLIMEDSLSDDEPWGFNLADVEEPPPGEYSSLLQIGNILDQDEVKSKSEHSGVQCGKIHFDVGEPDMELTLRDRRMSDPLPRVTEVEHLRLEIKALERKLEARNAPSSNKSYKRMERVYRNIEMRQMAEHDVDSPPQLAPNELAKIALVQKFGSLKCAARVKGGCLELQNIITKSTQSQLREIVDELLPTIGCLASDFFGNYVVQCIVKVATDSDLITLLCTALAPSLGSLSTTQTGTRVAQTLLGKCETNDQRSIVCHALSDHVCTLCKDPVGTYVVQKAADVLPAKYVDILFKGLSGRISEVSCDKNGACGIRTAMKRVTGDRRRQLLREICTDAKRLAMHGFGNYVIQACLQGEATQLVNALIPHVVDLSGNKHGSNVVETLIKRNDQERARTLQIIASHAQHLALDSYGNFVVQTAVHHATQNEFLQICNAVQPIVGELSQFKQGKTLLQLLRSRSFAP